MTLDSIKRVTRGLRFRLTFSYAVFFTLLLGVAGVIFHQSLSNYLRESTRDVLQQEWATLRTVLRFDDGRIVWVYNPADAEESYIVSRLQRLCFVANARGEVLQASDLYRSIGVESRQEILQTIDSQQVVWSVRRGADGVNYLIRSGVMYAGEDQKARYFVSIGRSLRDNRIVIERFVKTYTFVVPILIIGGCLLGWSLAGKALTPVTEVARAANRISGSNLKLRIATRDAEDELDYLIDTFNRMIERLEVGFRQLRQFTTDVSHELRTPITAARGQLEVAMFTATTTEQYREAIVDAVDALERLSQIIRALLQLSKAETGQIVLNREPLDLSNVVRNTVDQFDIPAEEAGVRLTVSTPAECPAELDRIQIERLISNLVANAVKFTPSGGEVSVRVAREHNVVRLEVEDTGCGIPEEHVPHIFDRLYRAPAQDSTSPKGLGLGLSFVAWIARVHGGSVTVKSEVNKGTRFTVTIPAKAPAPLVSQPGGVTVS